MGASGVKYDRWVKSPFSNEGANCTEIKRPSARKDLVLVRDSKNPDGPILQFSSAMWNTFTAQFRDEVGEQTQ